MKRFFPRQISEEILLATKAFSVIALLGPRRSGKTFLLQKLFPKAEYHLLEDPDKISIARSDPKGFLESVNLPVILDEIQNVPELIPYIRTLVDTTPTKMGSWFLTGSQQILMLDTISESLAGRVALFELLPLSANEIGTWDLLKGFFPEVLQKTPQRHIWFRSYLQTYLEKDVRSILGVKSLPLFRRFLALLAARNGQMLNKSALASPLGLSVPTLSEWLHVLEVTGHILVIPPFFENFEKRLVKTPKLYWVDPGLVCFLLGILDRKQLEASVFLGSIFEGFIASEIIKKQINAGQERALYYFRDSQGLEVDFIIPTGNRELHAIEVKWSKTVVPGMLNSLIRFAKAIEPRTSQLTLIHRQTHTPTVSQYRGVHIVSVEQFLNLKASK